MRYPVAETAQADDQFQPLRCGGAGVVVALMSLESFADILVATGIARSRRHRYTMRRNLTSVPAAVVVVGYNVGVWVV
jgi:hypothetical protein